MNLVVSCDYLMSPAYCSAEQLSECVESLVLINQALENGAGSILIERDSVKKLEDLGCYPCAQFFNHNLHQLNNNEYTGKDIARTVTNLLYKELNNDANFPDCAADWTVMSAIPSLTGRSEARNHALLEIIENISLSAHYFDKQYSIMHHPICEGNKITFHGVISSIIPELAVVLPEEIYTTISVLTDFEKFTISRSAKTLFDEAINEEDFINAFVAGTKAIIAQRGLQCPPPTAQSFNIGQHFLDSLTANQCGPGQSYSGPAFDAICHVLAGIGKYELKEFWTDTNKRNQRTRSDGHLAWRTHITKGNPTLRLMYWKDRNGRIELANAGPKNELRIL